MPARYAALPALGRLTGRGNTASLETVLASCPDVILDYGTINPTYVSLAERIQKQTGVPYLLFDGAFDQIAAVFQICRSRLSAVNERAEQLSRYAETMSPTSKTPRPGTGAKRPSVYYARGPRGSGDRPQGLDQCGKHRAHRRAQRRR